VLDRSAWAAWLDPSLDGEAAYALLTMPSVGDWRVDEVSTRVNKAEHDDPSCIVPIAPVSSSQGSLF
jgi:putative SOS response-associated peptidase YedK